MSAADKILAAIDECFAASPAPPTSGDVAAAVLRAAADQVVPEEQRPPRRGMRPGGTGALSPDEGAEDQRAATRRKLRAIATDLKGALSPVEVSLGLTDTQLEELFRAWWAESYPTPPGPHALMTHLGWARHLLEQAGTAASQPEQQR